MSLHLHKRSPPSFSAVENKQGGDATSENIEEITADAVAALQQLGGDAGLLGDSVAALQQLGGGVALVGDPRGAGQIQGEGGPIRDD